MRELIVCLSSFEQIDDMLWFTNFGSLKRFVLNILKVLFVSPNVKSGMWRKIVEGERSLLISVSWVWDELWEKVGHLKDESVMNKVWKWKLKWFLTTWLFLHWLVVCWNRKAMPELSLTFLGSEFTCLVSAFRAPSKLACHLSYHFIANNWCSWGKNLFQRGERPWKSSVFTSLPSKWDIWGPERWRTSLQVHSFLG